MKNKSINIQNQFLRRVFRINNSGLFTSSFLSLAPESELLQSGTSAEGFVRMNGHNWRLGGGEEAFHFLEDSLVLLPHGGQRLEIRLAPPPALPVGLQMTLIYEAPGKVPVLIKSLRLENDSGDAVHLDGMQVEAFTPLDGGAMSLMLDDDFVRDAQTIAGQPARSPWIEDHQVYVSYMLETHPAPTVFAYPHALDIWLSPGDRFSSFRSLRIRHALPERIRARACLEAGHTCPLALDPQAFPRLLPRTRRED